LPDFPRCNTPNWGKYTIQQQNVGNGHTTYQTTTNIPKGREVYQKFPFQGLSKYTKREIVGM
jgi:hypothetical protein